MKLEKAKKVIKIKKSQLQNQKQVQNVTVNLNAPKTTRKRAPNKSKSQQGPKKPPQPQVFQAPIYQPPVASFNPKTPETNFVLSEIMKHLKATTPANNQIEKPSEEQKELIKNLQVKPSLPQSFNMSEPPVKLLSLPEEVKSDPFMTRQSLINPPQFEATQTSFKFKPIEMTPASLIKEIKTTKPPPINITKEMKYQPPPDQMWAELEKGGHFGLLGINTEQLKAHKEAKKEFSYEALSLPVLAEEERPTGEEIDLGIVPFISQEIVKEDRVETNEPEIVKILTDEKKEETLISDAMKNISGGEKMQLKEARIGEDTQFNKELLYSQEKTKKKQPEPEPELKKQPEIELEILDPELKKLSDLPNKQLSDILRLLGGSQTLKKPNRSGKEQATRKNKKELLEEIEGLRKLNPFEFTKALNRY